MRLLQISAFVNLFLTLTHFRSVPFTTLSFSKSVSPFIVLSFALHVPLFLKLSCLRGKFVSSLFCSPMYFSFIQHYIYGSYCCIAFIDTIALPSYVPFLVACALCHCFCVHRLVRCRRHPTLATLPSHTRFVVFF